MAANASIYCLTKEQYEAHHEHKAFEQTFVENGKEGVDFSDVVHENYEYFWLCDRTWVIEDSLRPLPWGHTFKVSKQQLLDMIPKAAEYIHEDGVFREAKSVEYYQSALDELKDKLENFNEETHTLLIYSV